MKKRWVNKKNSTVGTKAMTEAAERLSPEKPFVTSNRPVRFAASYPENEPLLYWLRKDPSLVHCTYSRRRFCHPHSHHKPKAT